MSFSIHKHLNFNYSSDGFLKNSFLQSNSAIFQHFHLFDFYAVFSQLTVGVLVNVAILTSVVVLTPKKKKKKTTKELYCANYAKTPVVDQIIIFSAIVALFRLFCKSAPMLACFYGSCFFMPPFCYFHGYFNTIMRCLHLWAISLFVQDRYIAHLDPSSYLSKCSHFVLYVTLTGVAFLSAMHFAAPIYGFAAYRFLGAELTCALDHHSHYACIYAFYTLLFVQGPIYFPLVFWTVHYTAKMLCCFQNKHSQRCSSNQLFLSENNAANLQTHTKSSDFFSSCCLKNERITSKVSIPSPSPYKTRHIKLKHSINKLTSFYPTSSIANSKFLQNRIKSNVLTASKEVPTVLLTGWLLLLSYTPKLLHNGFVACYSLSTYPVITDEMSIPPFIVVATPTNHVEKKITFYITFFDETVSCVILPFLWFFFHSKLRHAFNCIFKCLFYICCKPFIENQTQSNSSHCKLNSFTAKPMQKSDSVKSMKKSFSRELNNCEHVITPTKLNQSVNFQVNCFKNRDSLYNNDENKIEITVI